MSQRLDIEIVGDDINFKLPTRCEQKNGGIWPLPKTVYTWNPHSFSRWCSQTPTSRCFHTSSIQLYACNNLWLGCNWKLKSSHGSTGLKQLLLTHHSGLSEVWPLMMFTHPSHSRTALPSVFPRGMAVKSNQSFNCRWWRLADSQVMNQTPSDESGSSKIYWPDRLPNTSWEGVLGMFSVFGVQIPPHKVFGSLGWMKGSWNTKAFMKISDSGNRETRCWRVAVQTGFQTESNKRPSHNGGRWMFFLNNEPHFEPCQDS